MGNTSSIEGDGIETTLANDGVLRQLGEKYPFSDDELRTLVSCFYHQEQHSSFSNRPFLIDLVLGSFGEYNKQLASDTLHTLKFIEGHIFPLGFGIALRKVAFPDDQDSQVPTPSIHTKAPYADQSESRVDFVMNGLAQMCGSPRSVIDEDMTSMSLLNTGLHQFLEAMTKLFGRTGPRCSLKLMFAVCRHCYNKDRNQRKARAQDLVLLGYQLGLSTFLLSQKNQSDIDDDEPFTSPPKNDSTAGRTVDPTMFLASGSGQGDPFLLSLGRSLYAAEDQRELMNNAEDWVSLRTFINWSESVVPLMSATLPTFMYQVMFSDKPFSPSRQPFLFPDLRDQSSSFFINKFSPRLFSFSCMSLSLGGVWHRLFTTDVDGFSFNRLQLALMGYGGPTLMVVEAVGGGLFGAYTSSTWKESKEFYGDSDCFLFQMEPTTRVYRPRGSGRNYMYCNSAARSKGFDQLAHGIGFGGTNEQPRLFISESLDECMAGDSDATFQSGPLLPENRKYFEIQSLEVWGCGGDAVVEEALIERQKARAIIDANILKAKKVDKAAFLDDLNSGLIESKAFKHREEIRGREGCDFDIENDSKR